ncbi:histidine phosphatase family protein [Rossellomorea aquimaris]|uniref:histidine phosphatase family protein n=1 Tax=Rossellomorea aquimaris TaxID=189382 RepID=UPI001CD63956|nr:histidine phosphatase family protein [Rossellomorea aquimaris]MCA1056566.1 histidine phosphatase family protein [Rossellomorea aquimaris]
MKTQVYFVRHAHSDYTPDELKRPLSKRGRSDAERVHALLKDQDIHAVCSSPYKRAIETVEGTATFFNKEIDLYEELKERQLSGEPVEDFNAAIMNVWNDPHHSLPGGESNVQAQERGVRGFLQMIETYEGKNIVVGTHGNIMVLIMNHFDEQYGYEFWKGLEMPDIYKLTFEGNEMTDVVRVWG